MATHHVIISSNSSKVPKPPGRAISASALNMKTIVSLKTKASFWLNRSANPRFGKIFFLLAPSFKNKKFSSNPIFSKQFLRILVSGVSQLYHFYSAPTLSFILYFAVRVLRVCIIEGQGYPKEAIEGLPDMGNLRYVAY